jgi:hypothetical protein
VLAACALIAAAASVASGQAQRAAVDSSAETRLRCGPDERPDNVAVFGEVRDAASGAAIDSVDVIVQWMDLTLERTGLKRLLVSRRALSDKGGHYTLCGVPGGATIVAWAARHDATTGAVFLALGRGPKRLDFTLDSLARQFAFDSEATRIPVSDAPPAALGTARYRAILRDVSGQSVAGARGRILGRGYVRADANGALTIDSIAGGTQSLEVIAIGYLPERRMVNVALGAAPPDSVVLTSLKSVLDTIRVTAGRDETGFDRRRYSKLGQFITAADVERENPVNTTNLLRTRDGLRLNFDKNGNVYIVDTGASGTCKPTIILDGFRADKASIAHVSGRADLDWAMHPEEIGGVEIYNHPGLIPIEFQRWMPHPNVCGAIVLWTRERLGLPRASLNTGSTKP